MNSLAMSCKSLLAFGLCAVLASVANAQSTGNTDAIATRYDVPTSTGHAIPAGAFGFLLIERPRKVSLMSLRGIGGAGRVILRTAQPGMCLTLPVRFVAGDLEGDTIKGELSTPVFVVIRNREAARMLANGKDIVSDTYHVSSRMGYPADFVLGSGLEESFGFVINPGRNILGDIFGVSAKRVSCRRL